MDVELGITALGVKSCAGAGPLLPHLTLLLRTPIAFPHKPTCWQSQAWCGSGKMRLLKYTFLSSVLHGTAFYIIKQNSTPEQILQTDEIKGKPSPIAEGPLGRRTTQGLCSWCLLQS